MTTRPSGGAPVGGATIIASLDIDHPWTRPLPSKLPALSMRFWILTLLSTSVGSVTADLVSTDLGSGLGIGMPATTAILCLLAASSLLWQVSTAHYLPGSYWLAVISVSVLGTLTSDDLVDRLGLDPWVASGVFCAALASVFVAWYATERTVSFHTVRTRLRELWYWLVVLGTFSWGASVGDLASETLGRRHASAGLVLVAALALTAFAYDRGWLSALAASWTAYVLIPPLGAALGDLLTATPQHGGLGLGTDATSAGLLVAILVIGLVTRRARDQDGKQSGAGQVGGSTVGP
jgi:uncharacterized membrane-anchored protein